MLENLLSSGFIFRDDEYELKTKYILLNSMLAILSITLSIMGVFRIITQYYTQAVIDYIAVLIGLIFLVLLRTFKKGDYIVLAYAMTLVSSVIIVLSYYTSNGVLNINAWFTALVIPIFDCQRGRDRGHKRSIYRKIVVIIYRGTFTIGLCLPSMLYRYLLHGKPTPCHNSDVRGSF